jgi:negative regulator of sigma-B (phosphoserine phosphatase)
MTDCFDWYVAESPLPGEAVSGDGYFVEPLADGGMLIGVLDGLGHGEEAHQTTLRALACLRRHCEQHLTELFHLCDQELEGWRGVVATLVRLDAASDRLSWLSFGNVTSLLINGDTGAWQECLQIGGIVGSRRLPRREPETLKVTPGDLLVLATDGVTPDFMRRISLSASPGETARGILSRHGTNSDDALVLVGRYLGGRRP